MTVHRSLAIVLSLVLGLMPLGSSLPVMAQATFSQSDARSVIKKEVRSLGNVEFRSPSEQIPPSVAPPIPLTGPGVGTANYYTVHVLGEVTRPGTYRVLPSDRVFDAIRYAGGILQTGSERSVQIRREGRVEYVDLYAYKARGNLDQNPYLAENDVVFVPVLKGLVHVDGPVGHPGSFELVRPASLKRVIALAGGFTVGRSVNEPIRVIRYEEDKKKIIPVDNSEKAMEQFLVRKGDFVIVPHVLLTKKKFDYNVRRIPGDNIFYPTINDNVYVIGAVTQPGPYPFQPNLSYQDYMSLAGVGHTGGYRRAKILRADGKQIRANKSTEINPGDTIIVPSKTVTINNLVAWFGTLTSLTLTTVLLVDRFND